MKIITISIIVILVLWFSLTIGLNTYLMHRQCANNVTEMGREYRYDIINGCRIRTDDGHYVFWQMYKVIDK